jgi:hypothetical protein
MSKKRMQKYEDFVSLVMAKSFNQKVSTKDLKSAAAKVAKAVEIEEPSRDLRKRAHA